LEKEEMNRERKPEKNKEERVIEKGRMNSERK
jgi:hypothetical protein